MLEWRNMRWVLNLSPENDPVSVSMLCDVEMEGRGRKHRAHGALDATLTRFEGFVLIYCTTSANGLRVLRLSQLRLS